MIDWIGFALEWFIVNVFLFFAWMFIAGIVNYHVPGYEYTTQYIALAAWTVTAFGPLVWLFKANKKHNAAIHNC